MSGIGEYDSKVELNHYSMMIIVSSRRSRNNVEVQISSIQTSGTM